MIGISVCLIFILSFLVIYFLINSILNYIENGESDDIKTEILEYKSIDINYEKRVLYNIIGYREVYENRDDPEYVYFGSPYPSVWIGKEDFRALFPLMAENYDRVGWFQCYKTVDHTPFSLFFGGISKYSL